MGCSQSGVKLAGHITIEQQAMIDMGATIIEDVSIGHDAVVEAGAVVLKNVPSQTIVSGVPAKNKTIVNWYTKWICDFDSTI